MILISPKGAPSFPIAHRLQIYIPKVTGVIITAWTAAWGNYYPSRPCFKKFTVKRASYGIILGWVTLGQVSQAACEQGQSASKKLVVICGAYR